MKRLYVSYQSLLVGELVVNNEHLYQFQYDASWLESTKAFALSCSLPLQAEAFSQRFSYAFFSNLIPEGDLRNKIARTLGISEKNDFAFLEAMGGEVAGAISLTPEWPYKEIEVSKSQYNLSEEQLAKVIKQLDSQPFLVAEEGMRLSLAGAQSKLPLIYSDQQFALPLGQEPSTHILKPEPDRLDIPDLAVNEAFCMALAQACGLQVANSELISISGKHCFLVERYDRVNKQRLHQEDFCQGLGILPFNKYESEGGPSFAECSELIVKFSSRPAADKKKLLQWTLFNYLIGNADAHGKNISFLYQSECVVSPFYDVLSTAIYADLNLRLSMKVGGENRPKWVMKRHWESYCVDIQVPFKMLQREARELIQQIEENRAKLAENQVFSDYAIVMERIEKVILQRVRWLNVRCGLDG